MSAIVECGEAAERWPRYRIDRWIEAAPICEIRGHGEALSILVRPHGDERVERVFLTEPGVISHVGVGDYVVRFRESWELRMPSMNATVRLPRLYYPAGFTSVLKAASLKDGYAPASEA